MRMSCNGCRILRKGCSDNCSIRPCLEWIKTPEAQANATVFLAKFYGRAGLMNLINSGPQHLRPSIFKSLLYEACGRIVNPIYGSVGLLWSGSWQLCQNAVEAVLTGSQITQMAINTAESKHGPPLKVYDIRHVNKDENVKELHKVRRNRCRFKKSGKRKTSCKNQKGWLIGVAESVKRSPSHESSLSQQSETSFPTVKREILADSTDTHHSDSCSVERAVESEVELDLTLGFEPFKRLEKQMVAAEELKRRIFNVSAEEDNESLRTELRLDYTASSPLRSGKSV